VKILVTAPTFRQFGQDLQGPPTHQEAHDQRATILLHRARVVLFSRVHKRLTPAAREEEDNERPTKPRWWRGRLIRWCGPAAPADLVNLDCGGLGEETPT
jgi:hypothetical protein